MFKELQPDLGKEKNTIGPLFPLLSKEENEVKTTLSNLGAMNICPTISGNLIDLVLQMSDYSDIWGKEPNKHDNVTLTVEIEMSSDRTLYSEYFRSH